MPVTEAMEADEVRACGREWWGGVRCGGCPAAVVPVPVPVTEATEADEVCRGLPGLLRLLQPAAASAPPPLARSHVAGCRDGKGGWPAARASVGGGRAGGGAPTPEPTPEPPRAPHSPPPARPQVFTTGTAVVVSPVGSITYQGQRRQYGEAGQPGPVALELYDQLTGLQTERYPDPFGWVCPVC